MDLFEEVEKCVSGFEPYYLRRKSEKEGRGVVAVVFGESCDGDFEVEDVVDYTASDFHLTFATIDNKKVGKRTVFLNEPAVATFEDFGHGGVIVRAFDSFDVEGAVFLAIGFAGGKPYHGGDGIGALDVGIVKTFYFHWQGGEVEHVLDAFE